MLQAGKKFVFDLVHLSFFVFTDKLFLHSENSRRKLLSLYRFTRIEQKIRIFPNSVNSVKRKNKKSLTNAN